MQREFAASYRTRAANNHLLERLADPLAAVTVASKIAHEVLEFDWEWTDPVDAVWTDLAGPVETDAPAEAFLVAYEAAAANPDRFEIPHSSGSQSILGQWGRWQKPSPTGGFAARPTLAGGWVGYFEEPLRDVLAKAGYALGEVLPAWKQRGWLQTDPDGRNKLKTQLAGKTIRLIALKLEAVEKLNGGPAGPSQSAASTGDAGDAPARVDVAPENCSVGG